MVLSYVFQVGCLGYQEPIKRLNFRRYTTAWMSRTGSDRINGDRINGLFHLLINGDIGVITH